MQPLNGMNWERQAGRFSFNAEVVTPKGKGSIRCFVVVGP